MPQRFFFHSVTLEKVQNSCSLRKKLGHTRNRTVVRGGTAWHGTAHRDQELLAAAGVGSHGENNWGWRFDAHQMAPVCFGL